MFRNEEEPGAACGEGFCGTRASVDIEVVEDHDVAGLQERGKLGLDIDVECRAIYCAFNDSGRNNPVASQTGNEGLRAPFSEGSTCLGNHPIFKRPVS